MGVEVMSEMKAGLRLVKLEDELSFCGKLDYR